MGAASYSILSRQAGLMNETRVIANNISNAATTGYRQEGLVFSEFIRGGLGDTSLSMARGQVRNTSQQQGVLSQTNGDFDLAIEGDGFFLLETPGGERLTRAGTFVPNAQGDLVNPDGYRLMDANGAPIFVPPDIDGITVGADGTVSGGGRLLGQIGLYQPVDVIGLIREGGVMFRAEGGVEPAEGATILQGFLEGSNVDAIDQMTRMIEIQRAYELGQSFLETEDQRIRNAVDTLLR
ncbi:flagellar hook-basal body complex protein [Ruegeria sp. WL0004]|uniref:Flagellar basal-body rod protein FlgF n=1 Tax=Ruegeria marisflavi TaxID=2984152 RepID=A0ABT2WL13_9RHOB|nr:flagellar hook-basal body complex protein [Ruegeria sp. WL0004]MCU9836392.1 flagellar hook-basal body complex protein [Ruegeria sp. WL0004]